MKESRTLNPVYAFAPGSNHIPYLEPVIKSILRNCKGATPHFCILLPCEQNSVPVYANCTFKIISDEDLDLCKRLYFQEGRADIPPFAAYSQLMLPRYFSEFKKILFLEVDQVVQHDLSPLWAKIAKEDIKLAAVRTLDGQTGDYIKTSDHFFTEENPGASSYNTGVFLFDTEHWIANSLEDKCLDYVKKQQQSKGQTYKFYAQGAINLALHDQINDFDPIYNWTGLGWLDSIPSHLLDQASILHWNGPSKPWLEDSRYRAYFLQASGMSSTEIGRLVLADLRAQGVKDNELPPSAPRKGIRYILRSAAKRILPI